MKTKRFRRFLVRTFPEHCYNDKHGNFVVDEKLKAIVDSKEPSILTTVTKSLDYMTSTTLVNEYRAYRRMDAYNYVRNNLDYILIKLL